MTPLASPTPILRASSLEMLQVAPVAVALASPAPLPVSHAIGFTSGGAPAASTPAPAPASLPPFKLPASATQTGPGTFTLPETTIEGNAHALRDRVLLYGVVAAAVGAGLAALIAVTKRRSAVVAGAVGAVAGAGAGAGAAYYLETKGA